MSVFTVFLRLLNLCLIVSFFVVLYGVYTSKMIVNQQYDTLRQLKKHAVALDKKHNQLTIELAIHTRADRLEFIAQEMTNLTVSKPEQFVTVDDLPENNTVDYLQFAEMETIADLINNLDNR